MQTFCTHWSPVNNKTWYIKLTEQLTIRFHPVPQLDNNPSISVRKLIEVRWKGVPQYSPMLCIQRKVRRHSAWIIDSRGTELEKTRSSSTPAPLRPNKARRTSEFCAMDISRRRSTAHAIFQFSSIARERESTCSSGKLGNMKKLYKEAPDDGLQRRHPPRRNRTNP